MKKHQASRFKSNTIVALTIALLSLIWGCEKDITLDLETGPEKLVVEGHIEPGYPPYVILTHNVPFFDLTDIEDLEKLFVHNADISVFDGTDTYKLIEYCSDSMPDSLLSLASLYLGVDMDLKF